MAKHCRRILNINDMVHWQKQCPGYNDLLSFVKQVNECAKGQHDAFHDLKTVTMPILVSTVQLLKDLRQLVETVKPFEDDKNQRFGNKAYRVWFDQMKSKLNEFFEDNFSEENGTELRVYLEESFGNQQRIDYGTGHELSFIIFLMGMYKLELFKESNTREMVKSISHQLLTIFAVAYLPVCRAVQLRYRLEPAGSHGVYSLDDFQFLPFLFGSSQLVAHPIIEPKNFYEPEICEQYAENFMFHAAVQFIHQVKKGPFHEHSNQLWNISAVESWSKINRGLLRMYCDEVLHKFPIVQHLLFGEKVLKWS